jgi:tetratricopeptide (TPR) repeat protein
MLLLRIRKAEVALKHGRLDEALQQVLVPDVRDHYRGQKLIAKLIPAFVSRGEKHLVDGRPDQALADFDRAENLAGNEPKIAQLKSAAQSAIREEVHRLRTQQNQIQQAKQLVAVGEYSLGQALCKDLATPDAVQLSEELQWRKQTVGQLLESAKQSLRAGDLESAFPKAQQLLVESSRNREVADFLIQLTSQFAEQAKRLIADGRLEHARAHLSRAHTLSPNHTELRELSDTLEQCLHAASFLNHVDTHQLTRRLKALRQIIGASQWLDKAVKDAESLTQSLESLRAATGCLLEQTLVHQTPMPSASNEPQQRVMHISPATSPDVWTNAFRLNVDEAGSFLVFRKHDIVMGPASQSHPVDLELQAPPTTPRVRIARSDGDYFLHADQSIMVNQQPTRDRLLQDGDRIQLGPRVAFRFRKPHAASGTANIELSSVTRLAPFSIRHIVLMDEALILGPQAGSHVVVPSAEGAAMLSYDGEQLRLRAYSSQPGGLVRMAPGNVLAAERTVSINAISVVAIPINKEVRKFAT